MVAKSTLQLQLRRVGFRSYIRGRGELKELNKILEPGESILECVHGYYQGGSGLLVITDWRILLIDKRAFFLNLEEIKYDCLSEVLLKKDFLQATLFLKCNKNRLTFKSPSDARLKSAAANIMEIREKYYSGAEFEPESIKKATLSKPYLNPGWRPHHTGLFIRPKKSKFVR